MKLDDQRAMNLKLRKAGFEARGLDEAAICQVAADQTDGFISEQTVEMLASAHRCKNWKRLVDTLVTVGRWYATDDHGEPGWYIHEYLTFNFSKAEWQELKDYRAAAGKLGGKASALAKAKAKAEALARANAEALEQQQIEQEFKQKPKQNSSRPVTTPSLDGGRNNKAPRGAPPAAEPDVPVDPEAATKMRAIRDTLEVKK